MKDDENADDIKEIILKYLDSRLEQWGAWYSKDNKLGTGYSNCSSEYRLANEVVVRIKKKNNNHCLVIHPQKKLKQR